MNEKEPDHRDWSEASDSLFRASRADHDPTASDRARVRTALAQRFADGAPITTGGGGPAAATKALGNAAVGNLVKVALGVAFVATGALVFTRQDDAQPGADKTELALARPTPVSKPAGQVVESGPRETRASSSTSPSGQTMNTTRPHGTSRRLHANAADENAQAPASRQAHSSMAPGAQPAAAEKATVQQGSASAHSEQGEPAAASTRGPEVSQTEPAPSESPAPTLAPVPARDDKLNDARSELDLVKRIHLAMQDGNLSNALALCAEHEHRWPHGTFALEREGIRAIASCESHSNEAGRRARAFLEKYPHAALAPRVTAACAPELARSAKNRPVSGID